jgi:hypothetical protein
MFGSARGLTKLAAIGLIMLMALGSVGLWVGIPLGWIYLASQMTNSSQPSLGPYVLILIGIPASMVVMGKVLGRINELFGRVTDTTPRVRLHMPWLRSMSGERDVHYPFTVLDLVMVISVAVALIAMAVWFFFFAGSPLPG